MHALSRPLRLSLEDLLAELRHARRRGDLGRLALLAYCDVRRWARTAGEPGLAEDAWRLFTGSPHASRDAFLVGIDALIAGLEAAAERSDADAPASAGRAPAPHAHGRVVPRS